jgi:hypothetical protein
MKKLACEIYEAVRSGKLRQPFNAAKVKRACPGWAARTYNTFPGKHAVENGNTTELFARVGYGLYRINA